MFVSQIAQFVIMNATEILIVEDELLIAKNLARKLEKLGYKIVNIVSSGDRAIENALSLQPDLILMDIAIKGKIDGIETAAKIYEQLHIPIIYTTAYADDNTIQRAEETGSYGYLIKPFQERDLHATIKMALSKHKEAIATKESLIEAENIKEKASNYLSMAFHDLRLPLTNIQISSDLLKHYQLTTDEQKQTKYFQQINRSVSNINKLLDGVLTLCKAESGVLPVAPNPIALDRFCNSLLEELEPISFGKHELLFDLDRECSTIYLDEHLLHHILVNLLGNAIKYSPRGGKINLKIKPKIDRIIFEIQDRGIGIPEEEQKTVFEQYTRASNAKNIQGTGLGLWFVKHLVELQDGEIYLDSVVDKGTKFTVILPLQRN
jgi:signal transduction histidine kinase